uniref:PadR family transcriptional regulator n=1 Tax=Ignisphaera aggregans TaxID=334771 RepID=A0A7J3QCX4_9CREN
MSRKAKYSWLRNLILAILATGSDIHGYIIYKRIENIVGEKWKPSIGTFYRVLVKLREEGLIECYRQNRRNICKITDKGIDYILSNIVSHLPKFIGILSEILSAYRQILSSKKMEMPLEIKVKLNRLIEVLSIENHKTFKNS